MRFVLFIVLSFLYAAPAIAQQDYAVVDSVMRAYNKKIKSADDLYHLTYFIRNNFTEDSLRLRASFIWITENIGYDVKALQEDRSAEASGLNYVLQNKKAVCGGYAILLKYFCDAFRIESNVIHGRARAGKRDIYIANPRLQANHAWNAVKINNQWRLIDATWAAGTVDDEDEENRRFDKRYNEFYYFSPPERFILNHYPLQPAFAYLPKVPLATVFLKQPLFTTQYLQAANKQIFPDSSLLSCKVGDTLSFRFNGPEAVLNVRAWSENKKAQHTGYTQLVNDSYIYKYVVPVSGFYNLYLGFNNDKYAMVVYKIKAETTR